MLIQALEEARTDASDVENVGQQIVAKAHQAGLSPKRFHDVAIAGSACQPMRPAAKAGSRG